MVLQSLECYSIFVTTIKARPRRRTRRDVNLDATRTHVVEAARGLFFSRGYARTTIGAIAGEAGVAVQTIYNAVGPKAAILKLVFEATVAGPAAPRRVPEFMRERTAGAPEVLGMVRLLADWFAEVHGRMAPLWQVIDEAAAHDPDVARFERDRALARLGHYVEAARELKRRGGAPGLGIEDLAALLFAIGHPRIHRTLVGDRGWSPARYRRWVEAALTTGLAPR
jgi:AcrR family transcriptional regulator